MSKIVKGQGPIPTDVMICGEAPGFLEERFGYPFVHAAPTGSLLNWLLATYTNLERQECFLTNLYKSHIEGDEDPTPEQIRDHEWMLLQELDRVRPKYLIALGRFASSYFLEEEVAMEVCHGIPYRKSFLLTNWEGRSYYHKCIVIPCFHPAAGLHNSSKLQLVVEDFKAITSIMAGRLQAPVNQFPNSSYDLVDDPERIAAFAFHKYIAIDSEGDPREPYLYQLCADPGKAIAFMASNKECCRALDEILAVGPTAVFHNALHDLSCFDTSGIHCPRFLDTMVLAYLLQIHPQGLKPLAYRLAGMKMLSYGELIAPYELEHTTEYIADVAMDEWGFTPARLEWEGGDWKMKRPWSLNRRLNGIMLGIAKGKTNIRELWNNAVEAVPGKVIRSVYDKYGPMPEVGLEKVEPFSKALNYACSDADGTRRVLDPLLSEVHGMMLARVCKIDHDILPMVHRMQKIGIRVRENYYEPLSRYLQKEMDTNADRIADLTGVYINPGSGDQVADLLYTKMGLPVIKMTKSKSRGRVGEDILKTIQNRIEDPVAIEVIENVIDYTECSKLKGTYCDALPRFTSRDGRIHPKYRVTRVPSGRLAASDPNLLAQPTRSLLGKKIRKGFIPGEGLEFTTVDLSQIELRVLAHLSQDPVFLQVFREGLDLHDRTEQSVFGSSGVNRIPAKTCNFGIVYGLTAPGLRLQLMKEGIEKTVEECQAMIDGWFDTYTGVRLYFDKCISFTRMHGFIRDMWGRIRYLPLIYSSDEYKSAEAERQACNHVVQSGAQGIMKIAMKNVWDNVFPEFWDEGIYLEPILQIHDELLMENEKGWGVLLQARVIDEFEKAVPLDVPVIAEGSTASNWGDLK